MIKIMCSYQIVNQNHVEKKFDSVYVLYLGKYIQSGHLKSKN